MIKVKIIDVKNNKVLDELLFAYDNVVEEVMMELKPFVSKMSDNNINIITETCNKDCYITKTTFGISSVILRRINSVNPYKE